MTDRFNKADELGVLPDRAIVYRALLRKQWIDERTGEVTFRAYLLRPNEQGLSVRIAASFSPEQFAARFRNCYGIASLQVSRIRGLGLDVVPDSPSHANITGLPSVDEDGDRVIQLAILLAQQSQIVWLP